MATPAVVFLLADCGRFLTTLRLWIKYGLWPELVIIGCWAEEFWVVKTRESRCFEDAGRRELFFCFVLYGLLAFCVPGFVV